MKNKCIIFLFCHSILLLAACTGGFWFNTDIKGVQMLDQNEICFLNHATPT